MPAQIHAQARTPHMTAIAVVSAAAGFIQLATGNLPANITHSAVYGSSVSWSLLLLIGGIATVAGAWMTPVGLGLRVESVGHAGLLFGALIYLVAALTWMKVPWYTSPAVWWSVALVVASAVRWWQVWRVLRMVRRARV